MRNKLTDLNDYLFEELENLMDKDLTQDELDREIKTAKQVVSVSQTIINNANLLLQAKKHFLVTEAESLIMSTNGLLYENAELTKTGSLIAKVIDRTNKIKKWRD